MSQLCNGCKAYAIIVNGGYGVNDACRHEGGDNMPPNPSDPHTLNQMSWEDGFKQRIAGHPLEPYAGKWFRLGWMAADKVEKEREMKAKEVKNGPRP